MKSDDILAAVDSVGKKWTAQVKAEERSQRAYERRSDMWKPQRTSLKDICWHFMSEAWDKASDGGRLPAHWRMVFYVIRPLCDGHQLSDRPLGDSTFKNILEEYLEWKAPGWDVLRGARGVFKEPHRSEFDNGLPMSTMAVRTYLNAEASDGSLPLMSKRFPTHGAENRIAAVLICEKEGFDDLLSAERIPERYDLALMRTKGISARAARDLARGIGVPCFTLHDFDKNGFVMAAGFKDIATDIGIRIADVEEWSLEPELQFHQNPAKARWNLLDNGATDEEARFIADGQRVELNMLTGRDFIAFVEAKLDDHGVEKVIPDNATLEKAWTRAHLAHRVNTLIDLVQSDEASGSNDDAGRSVLTSRRGVPSMPTDLAERIKQEFDADDSQSWDEVLWDIVGSDLEVDDGA